MRTTYIAKEADIVKKWYVIDAEGVTLGRLASEVASILRGKNKPQYAPNADMGDYVIIVNAEKVAVTGKKLEQKMYRHHSGWTGGLKETRLDKMLETHPERVIEHAVKGMLPKNALGRKMFGKLHVYAGAEHPHAAQNKRDIDEYFGLETLKLIVRQPLELTETAAKFDVIVNVCGGGFTGQAGAIRHGISRALLQADGDYRPSLKKAGFLTRDPRMKERKKPGLKAARRAPQFSKR